MSSEPNDPILRRARADLVLAEGRDRGDTFLWEHSRRIADLAGRIATTCLGTVKYDPLAIRLAGLYHDAGWIVQVRDKVITRYEVLTRPTSPEQRILAAEMMASRLAGLAPPTTLQRAMQVVTHLNQREQSLPEGQVVSEAETLDEIGLLSLWPAIRKQMLEGRDVQTFVTQWRRQIEYKFWDARINDTIRFEPVRIAARNRLAELTEFIERVAKLQEGCDFASLSAKKPSL